MQMANRKGFFGVGCVVITLITSLWPIYLFSLNEDSVQIEFKEFYSSQDRLYPALTLCYDRATFHKFNQTSTDRFGIDMQHQVFSNQSTLDIEDYITNIVIKDMKNNQTRFTRAGVTAVANIAIKDKSLSLNTILRRYKSTSCFAIGLPFFHEKGINSMNVGIRKSIFKNGVAPTRNQMIHGKGQLNVGLSYQNRHFPLLSRDAKELRSHDSMNNICSGLIFKVRGMEVVSQRSKPSRPCYDYTNDDTTKALNDAANNVGCMPRGWEIDSTLPLCQRNELNVSARQLFDDSLYNSNAKQLIQPCRSVVDLWYDSFDEVIDSCTDEQDILHVTVVYNNLHFKEMKLVRAFSIWNLFSSITVIMGLFLGVSLLQLPEILNKAIVEKRNEQIPVSYETRYAKEITKVLTHMKTEVGALKPTKPAQKKGLETAV